MFSKSITLLTIAFFVSLLFVSKVGQNPVQEPQVDKSAKKNVDKSNLFMRQKLKHSSQIMEGLAVKDFQKIGESAEALMLLSQEEDWNEIKTPAYLKMSNEFRASASRLREQADKKQLDGATLSFFEVTLNCVRCHKYVRDNH